MYSKILNLRKKPREACKKATTDGDAIRNVAKVLFTEQELLECTVSGRHTNKSVEQCNDLDLIKLNFLVCKCSSSSSGY